MNYLKTTVAIFLFSITFSCNDIIPGRTDNQNKPLPEFQIQLIDSTSALQSQNFSKGYPFIVMIFDPECGFCQAELKGIIKNITLFKDIHFYLITYASHSQTLSFYNQFKLSRFENITIGRDTAFSTLNYYKLSAVPYTLIFDKNRLLKRVFDNKVEAKVLYESLKNI